MSLTKDNYRARDYVVLSAWYTVLAISPGFSLIICLNFVPQVVSTFQNSRHFENRRKEDPGEEVVLYFETQRLLRITPVQSLNSLLPALFNEGLNPGRKIRESFSFPARVKPRSQALSTASLCQREAVEREQGWRGSISISYAEPSRLEERDLSFRVKKPTAQPSAHPSASGLRTLALIVSAHPYCARNPHATSYIERAR